MGQRWRSLEAQSSPYDGECQLDLYHVLGEPRASAQGRGLGLEKEERPPIRVGRGGSSTFSRHPRGADWSAGGGCARALELWRACAAVRGLDGCGIEAFLVLAIFQRSQEAELDTAEATLGDLVAGSLPSGGASLGQGLLWRVGAARTRDSERRARHRNVGGARHPVRAALDAAAESSAA